MAITYSPNLIHWNYFLALEEEFEKISRYVEFCQENSKTFSIEFAKLIMSTGSEIDVLLKQICKIKIPNSTADKITQYRPIITSNIPKFSLEKVFMPRFGMETCPWSVWTNPTGNPIWWTDYNLVKHRRNSEFGKANLTNSFNALAALLVTVSYFYKLEKNIAEWGDLHDLLKPNSNLLKLDETYYYGEVKVGKLEWYV